MINITKYSRRLALIMAGTISLSLCGCEMADGRTAQGEARTTYIYGDSIQEDAGASLMAKLGVPDSCKLTFDTGKSGLSEISLDTDDIDVPGTDRAYVIDFDRIGLTQEKIQSMVEGVFDKSDGIYCRDDGDENMTKDEIQQGIDLIEAYRDQALKDGKTDVADMYESDIAAEKTRMASAPDTYRSVTEYTSGKIYVGQSDGDKFNLWISGGDDEDGASAVSIEYSADASRDQDYLANVPDAVITETVGEVDSGVDAGDQQNMCSLDENSARIMAQEFLDKLGISGMAFRSSQALIRTWLDGNMTYIKTEKNGYVFEFGRQIAGISVVYEDPTGVDNLKNDKGYVMHDGDLASVYVDDKGVFSVRARLTTDPDSFVREDTGMLSWTDMLERANDNISEYYSKYPTAYSKVQFDSARLLYVPCKKDDGGLAYVPAWMLTEKDDKDILDNSAAYHNIVQMVYINAIDGSLIDIVETAKALGTWYSYGDDDGGIKTLTR